MQPDPSDAYEALMQFLYRAPIGLAQTTLDGSVEMLNPMASNLLMPLATEAGLDNLFEVLAPVAPQLAQMVQAFIEPSGVICEGLRLPVGVAHAASGTLQVLSLSLLKLDRERLMATVADATFEVQREQETLHRRLRNAARTDALTRMPNREAVREELQRLITAQQAADVADEPRFAVLLINGDRFRQVNDSLGQASGDQLLMHMADRLRGALRPTGGNFDDGAARPPGSQLAARIGGDEFVVVLETMRNRSDAERLAIRLLDALARPYLIDGHEIVCHASLGLAWGAGAAPDADAVLRDAGIAMVEAKRAGGNRHTVFDPSMRERAARRADIEADLRTALAEEQLFVVYQPVVGLHADGVVDFSAGVEALVRWRHPLRGIVPPGDFIQVAEECGLIGAVGDFVLERACRDYMAWQARMGASAPRLMAVNLSRAQLGQPGWIDTVRAIVDASGMPPGALQLEVTESLAAQDEDIQGRLHELKGLGIKLALDDFGTGYSSLSSLHLLPVDTVKIDRSFVSKADTSAHHRVLIEATVKVAQSLGMNTVAEGIETQSQLDVVRSQRCDKAQGFFYSKPLPAPELLAWLDQKMAVAA